MIPGDKRYAYYTISTGKNKLLFWGRKRIVTPVWTIHVRLLRKRGIILETLDEIYQAV